MIPREELEAEFVEALRKRWAAGAIEYGDASFHRRPVDTAEEILEELIDVAGWAFIAWVQMRLRLGRALAAAIRVEAAAQKEPTP